MVCPVIQQVIAVEPGAGQSRRPAWGVEFEETMVYTDYIWVDISDWDFGRMHEELRALSTQGWEVDSVIDDLPQAPATGGGSGPATVSLRLKRQRKY